MLPESEKIETLHPRTIDELAEAVRTNAKVTPAGAGTKPALYPDSGYKRISLSSFQSVLEYDPAEFMLTAEAGTPLKEISRLLAKHGQHLPFDPPLAHSGATIGGTIAAGLSGPGRLQYGGLRDFILALRFIDGSGTLIRGGAKVVKNAAGFDFPKLMTGSLGRLGMITEATFKVFPRPDETATLTIRLAGLDSALAILIRLLRSKFDLQALDLSPPETLAIRIGGARESLPARLEALQRFIGTTGEVLSGDREAAHWSRFTEFEYCPENAALVKIPVTPKRIRRLDAFLETHGAIRHYGAGGQVCWAAWFGAMDVLCEILREQRLPGLILRGGTGNPLTGAQPGSSFLQRIKGAMDPLERFAPF